MKHCPNNAQVLSTASRGMLKCSCEFGMETARRKSANPVCQNQEPQCRRKPTQMCSWKSSTTTSWKIVANSSRSSLPVIRKPWSALTRSSSLKGSFWGWTVKKKFPRVKPEKKLRQSSWGNASQSIKRALAQGMLWLFFDPFFYYNKTGSLAFFVPIYES